MTFASPIAAALDSAATVLAAGAFADDALSARISAAAAHAGVSEAALCHAWLAGGPGALRGAALA